MVQYTYKTREFLKVTWVGLWVNVVLSILKILAGIIGNSRAVVADGVHTLSDLVGDVLLLIGVRFWSAPPDKDHPYGHQRVESLITLGIALILAFLGIGLVYEATLSMLAGTRGAVGLVAALAALLSIVIKEILYRWTVRKGKKLRSSALIANAWHHRSDALSSIPVFFSAGIAYIAPGLIILDLIGTIIVAVFLGSAAWKIAWPALNELADRGVCSKTRAKLLKTASAVPGVRDAHAIRTRFLGSDVQVDLHIMVDGNISVDEGHKIATAVEDALMAAGPDVIDALVHVEPWSQEGKLHEREQHLHRK
jgi:cation diffusion facilitator family transporter